MPFFCLEQPSSLQMNKSCIAQVRHYKKSPVLQKKRLKLVLGSAPQLPTLIKLEAAPSHSGHHFQNRREDVLLVRLAIASNSRSKWPRLESRQGCISGNLWNKIEACGLFITQARKILSYTQVNQTLNKIRKTSV